MVHRFKFGTGVLLWLPILLVSMGTGGGCDKIEFYRKKNYEGLIDEYDLSGDEGGKCRNFLFNSLDIKSVKTDRCVMLFGTLGCDIHHRHSSPFLPETDSSYSLRVDADTPEVTGTLNEGGTQIVHSFGPCSRERGGGPEVDVDFYDHSEYRGEITASYRDVCGCQNLKKSAVGGKSPKISVDNHGHALDFFEGADCTGQKRSVRAGSNWATKWMWDPRDGMGYFDIQSFQPSNAQGCTKQNASIHKLMLDAVSQGMIDEATEESVKLTMHSTLSNNSAQSNVGTGSDSIRVQIYEKYNYEGFVKQFDVSGDEAKRCQRLDPELRVKSLKTNGCIMLFGDPHCNQLVQVIPEYKIIFSYSLRFDADTPEIDQMISEGPEYSIARSFAICSRELGGGPEVDVIFYSETDYRGNITAEYLDVRGCQNVDKAAVGGKSRRISVENTGHSIEFFEGENCTGQMRTVRAGVNWANRWMWDSGDQMAYFDVHSFCPTNYQNNE